MARLAYLGAMLAIAAALACGSPPPSPERAREVFGRNDGVTRVNLHPDEARRLLYAVNYQQTGLIPACSEVEYLGLAPGIFRFRVASTGREYTYRYHEAAGEPFIDHLKRFFGPSCPREEIEALSELDRRGLREGRPIVGMTRRGVLLAMGPPPRHVNPDPKGAPTLMYWKGRVDRLEIFLGPDDRVTRIVD